MPLGNGQVGINLWVEAGGDLHFYISRTDSLSEMSRLLKVGGVRVSLSPNPFAAGSAVQTGTSPARGPLRNHGRRRRQEGDAVGVRRCRSAGRACRGQVGVAGVGQSHDRELAHDAARYCRQETSRSRRGPCTTRLSRSPSRPTSFPATSATRWPGIIATRRRCFRVTLKHQGLEAAADKVRDPLLHRTFGGWIAAPGFKAVDARSLATPAPVEVVRRSRRRAVRTDAGCKGVARSGQEALRRSADAQEAMQRTAAWWQAFWERSWVFVNGDRAVDDSRTAAPAADWARFARRQRLLRQARTRQRLRTRALRRRDRPTCRRQNEASRRRSSEG